MSVPDRQLNPPDPEFTQDEFEEREREAKAKVLQTIDRGVLAEAFGPDSWHQSPTHRSLSEIENLLWALITEPLSRGEHPEYGSYRDAQIGWLVRTHAADYIDRWAEKEARRRGLI